MNFNDLLSNDKFIILDGAMGTMLQKSGLKLGGLPEELNFTNPDLIEDIHRQYIAAGAQAVYANTFGANRNKLKNSKYSNCDAKIFESIKRNIKERRQIFIIFLLSTLYFFII